MKVTNNQNNFNGTTNFNGPVQFVGGDIINESTDSKQDKVKYTPEPKWRSPFTLAVLSWISVIIGIFGLFPIGKILANELSFFKGNMQTVEQFPVQTYLMISIIFVLLFVLFFRLRRIAKKQIRVPLILNYAISGYDRRITLEKIHVDKCHTKINHNRFMRITLEKIHVDKCPQCGGKMKYYNKPVEWREIVRTDGSVKYEVTKKVPVLECRRNPKHCYEVDPAEDRVK